MLLYDDVFFLAIEFRPPSSPNSPCNELKINAYENISFVAIKNGIHNQKGYVYSNINIPLTVLGGAGTFEDLKRLINKFQILGIAAGSIFIFKGKHKAVLINYPDPKQKNLIINKK